MYTLGISAFYHDSAVTLLKDDKIIAACSEERLTRVKNDERFPHHALSYVLREAQITLADVDAIVFYEKPILKFERILESFLSNTPQGLQSFLYGAPKLLKKFFFRRIIITELAKHQADKRKIRSEKLFFSTHHLSHAASAFYPSPFKNALILTLDGVGEWTTTAIFKGSDRELTAIKEIHFPNSLGMLYSTFTSLLGFKVNEGEYKVMGLAPYGSPTLLETFKKELLEIHDDGSFTLNMQYFNYTRTKSMYSKKLLHLCGLNKQRKSDEEITQQHMDIAASLQKLLEYTLLCIVKTLKTQYEFENLCLAGGVALNCVANGLLEREAGLDGIWIQPAAGDAGGSLGAALAYYHLHTAGQRKINYPDAMNGSYLGPSFKSESIEYAIESYSDRLKVMRPSSEDELISYCVSQLTAEKTIGWFQGRMEFGPRALGSRSILADPRSRNMQKTLNMKIKFRESFRPFAPVVLSDEGHHWFEHYSSSPYMLKVYSLKQDKREQLSEMDTQKKGLERLSCVHSQVPAVTHVDYTSRVQTLEKSTNPRLYKLIKKFQEATGVAMLVNTSFNLKDEPIVCSPIDALNCFFNCDLDILVMEDIILTKNC